MTWKLTYHETTTPHANTSSNSPPVQHNYHETLDASATFVLDGGHGWVAQNVTGTLAYGEDWTETYPQGTSGCSGSASVSIKSAGFQQLYGGGSGQRVEFGVSYVPRNGSSQDIYKATPLTLTCFGPEYVTTATPNPIRNVLDYVPLVYHDSNLGTSANLAYKTCQGPPRVGTYFYYLPVSRSGVTQDRKFSYSWTLTPIKQGPNPKCA